MEQVESTSGLPHQACGSDEQPIPKKKLFDFLREPHPEDLTPFQRFVVELEWTKSPLGPITSWPAQLHQMVLLVMHDPMPAAIYWGDEATVVYNEAYTQLIGQKHPTLQGRDPNIEFVEIWDHFEDLLARQRETGETAIEADTPLLLFRHGFLEETYFSWKFVPIIGPEGWVVGSHATVVEVTREVLSNRRLAIARNLGGQVSEATTTQELWAGVIRGLELAERDIPMAMLYSVAATTPVAAKIVTPMPRRKEGSPGTLPPLACLLEQSLGVPKDHPLAPPNLSPETDRANILFFMYQSLEMMKPLVVPLGPETQHLLEGITWRGHGTPPKSLVVCPIIPMHSKSVLAFLVVAVNPHRPYDEDYQEFVNMITKQVTIPQLTAVILREEVARRALDARQEAIDRKRLYKELSESESKFARFAQRAPIGLAILKLDGTALSANELWRDLTTLQVGDTTMNWQEVLADGEFDPVITAWEKMVAGKRSLTFQTRIRRPWRAPELDRDGKEQITDTNILVAMYPDLDENGEVVTVMSCITDITSLAWSESQLRRRMDQAMKMKNQQEKFIDMTSHEMRNPLSALIGCADEIIESLSKFKTSNLDISTRDEDNSSSYVDEAIEAAETIIYCAMHQKRIIDDILTLSRLDSNLLLVSPEPSQPIKLVRNALKMFQAELKRSDTILNFVEQQSLLELGVDWTLLDPGRVLQVLINLVTNAVKFTRTEPRRLITITIGASLSVPAEDTDHGIQYVKKSENNMDQTSKVEWGDGEVIYLSIAVTDTGRGLSEREKKNLFHIFKQASPKTYTQYGGSGLGLFISRQLVEMQGGKIGVASESNHGSTFKFYIKTRRTTEAIDTTKKPDLQLLVREDALREACASEIPGLQNGIKMPEIKSDNLRHPSLVIDDTPGCFHILVVEDNLVNQKVLSKQLRKTGHVVSVANHGEEALDFIRRSEHWHSVAIGAVERGEPLDVVLMDLEMPIMDGITCVMKIRELQHLGKICRHLPVIAVTANARKDQIVKSLEAGMDDVMTKPYRLQDMLKQIERLVAKYISGSRPTS